MSLNPPRLRSVNPLAFIANLAINLRDRLTSGVDGPGRDLDKECKYPVETLDLYHRLYAREGLATRVVDVYPDECWAVYPEVYESETPTEKTRFERAWSDLLTTRDLNPWHHLHRADRLSGIGRYGVVLLGLSDLTDTRRTLASPVPGVRPDGSVDPTKLQPNLKLLYLRSFPERLARVEAVETDPGNPRYGKPTRYAVSFSDPDDLLTGTLTTDDVTVADTPVHWSRVVHLADNRASSDVYGTPRLRPVLNRIHDLRKILGGSAEMFWKGGFPGYVFETFENLSADAELDFDTTKEQFTSFMDGLQRYMAVTGGSVKSLLPQAVDPTNHFDVQVKVISAVTGCPARKLLGSEAGHLASTQDDGTWNRRLAGRQGLYLDPMVVRPFVDTLVAYGVLPTPASGAYKTSWTDLNSVSKKDQADTGLKLTQALLQYVTSGAEVVVPPREWLTVFLNLSPDQADQIVSAAKDRGTVYLTEKVWKKPAAAGPASGNPTGRPARNALGA